MYSNKFFILQRNIITIRGSNSYFSSNLTSYCQAQPKPKLSPIQLSWAEIALFSQLWGTAIHHTPYTTPYTIHLAPGIVVSAIATAI